MGQPIVHFEILGQDSATLQQFYAKLFDWEVGPPQPELGNYATVDASSSGLGGGIGQPGCDSMANALTFYVEVPDLQAALDQAVALGGRIVTPPMEIPNIVTFAQFADPAGNVVGLVKGGPQS